jgi:hypothetical protein
MSRRVLEQQQNTAEQTPGLGSDTAKAVAGSCLTARGVHFATRFTGAVIPILGLLFIGTATAQLAEPRAKPLVPAADPLKKAVLIGRVAANAMVVQLELEGAEPMWMQMGNPPVWDPHQPTADERYHVELKLTDPKSKTRIPFAVSTFTAINKDTGKTMTLLLPAMWGKSGLHYSANSHFWETASIPRL